LRRELRGTQETVKELQAKLDRSLTSISEKEDNELNTLWAEFENVRGELIAQLGSGINIAQWRALLESRIPSFSIIKEQLGIIMATNNELADQLCRSLPAYLTGDDLLPGLLDIVRTPFENINWVDSLILPIGAKLDGPERAQLEAPFNRLLGALGYSSIEPGMGDMYQPDHHEVVEQRLSGSQRGAILATRARGYRKGGTVVRKAKVIISTGQN